MKNLEACISNAKQLKMKYIGILIRMEGFEEDELIVNHYNNFDKKLEYYKNTYDEQLNHKFSKGISIVAFTFGNDLSEIEEDLLF